MNIVCFSLKKKIMASTEKENRWSFCLNFEEEFLPVEKVGNEHPQRSSPQALEEPLPVTPLEAHLPAEWEVETQERVANIHKDGVHPWGGEEMRQSFYWKVQNKKTLSLTTQIQHTGSFDLWIYSTWIYEWLSTPPTLDISDKVHASEEQEGEAAHTHHIGQWPGETDHQQHTFGHH